MANFQTRIRSISKKRGKLILANDYEPSSANLFSKTTKNIRKLHPYLCGLKLNFHVLLPLGGNEIKKINQLSHKYGLVTIADIKLNDIGNTNVFTLQTLWNLGFDAVIVNPIMGPENLKKLVRFSHKKGKGIITLCHMSSPEAKLSYDLDVKTKGTKKHTPLYQLFLKWALSNKVDGIIVGATFPTIINYCKKKIKNRLRIYSPGIGIQGGDISKVLLAGTDFCIVGRTILNSKNPIKVAKNLQSLTFE